MRDGVCRLPEKLAEVVQRAQAELTFEKLFGGVLAVLREGKGLASVAKCVRERMCIDKVSVIDGDVRMVFVKERFINGGLWSSPGDYNRSSMY